jgi:hypothetical protein
LSDGTLCWLARKKKKKKKNKNESDRGKEYFYIMNRLALSSSRSKLVMLLAWRSKRGLLFACFVILVFMALAAASYSRAGRSYDPCVKTETIDVVFSWVRVMAFLFLFFVM